MDYMNLSARVQTLSKQFPFLQTGSLGRSLLGKELFCLTFRPSGRCEPDPPLVLFTGAFHGMEWLTATLLLAFAENLCVRLEQGTACLPCPLVIVPCVNPDGVNIQIHGIGAAGRFSHLVRNASRNDVSHWQANARGVDLNHNFDANWKTLRQMEQKAGICGPAATRFGGCFPVSEPESRHLVRFCRARNVRLAAAFHSQGEEIYYQFGDDLPPGSREIAEQLADVSGYALAQPNGLASFGGFKDWFVQEFCRPAFTIEVGKGKNPLPVSDFPGIYPKMEAICYALLSASADSAVNG